MVGIVLLWTLACHRKQELADEFDQHALLSSKASSRSHFRYRLQSGRGRRNECGHLVKRVSLIEYGCLRVADWACLLVGTCAVISRVER